MTAIAAAQPQVVRRRFVEWSMLVPALMTGVGITLYILCFTLYKTHLPIDSDGEGYYAYLPSYLLRHDPTFNYVLYLDILPTYAAIGHLPPAQFGFSLQPTGAWLDKYAVGVALLQSPFFLLGHALALVRGTANADGYSDIELYTVGLAALFYLIAGLFLLRAVLRRWFSDGVVAITLLALALGSGAFVYASWEPGYSHDFAFFSVCLMLLFALRWYERPRSWLRAALLGLAMGLVIAIRLTNVELLLAVPLLAVGTVAAARQRLTLIRSHLPKLGVIAACTLVPLVPQAVTWWYATGHLIVRPYAGESFDFAHPALLQTLVWLQPHGLLPYYPVLGLALIGLFVAWFRRRDIAVPVTLTFLGFFYIVASWWNWSYRGAFGDRAFIDVAPLLAIPLAFLLATLRRGWQRRAGYTLTLALVVMTCMLMVAYLQGRLSQDGISASGYFQVLVHPHRLLDPPIKPKWRQ